MIPTKKTAQNKIKTVQTQPNKNFCGKNIPKTGQPLILLLLGFMNIDVFLWQNSILFLETLGKIGRCAEAS